MLYRIPDFEKGIKIELVGMYLDRIKEIRLYFCIKLMLQKMQQPLLLNMQLMNM